MIGVAVLRCAHYQLALVAESEEVDQDRKCFRGKVVLLGEGMRVEAPLLLYGSELPVLIERLRELIDDERTKIEFVNEAANVYLALERSGRSYNVAFRMMREPETGLLSTGETRTWAAQLEELSRTASRWPK